MMHNDYHSIVIIIELTHDDHALIVLFWTFD